jgi:hypothetical protein
VIYEKQFSCVSYFIGDATAFFRFTHAFSQFYQGLRLVYPPPTFEKPVFPEPSECTIEELRPLMYYLHELYSEEELRKKYSEREHTSERVDWFFERQELETLCDSLRQRSPSAASRLSIYDSLSAYIVTVINRILPSQIRKIKATDSVCWRSVVLLTDPADAVILVSLLWSKLRISRCCWQCYN